MKRSELREHIFRVLFGIEFNTEAELPEQMELYFSQLEQADDTAFAYIQAKAQKIADKTEEIDKLLNEHTTGWKTSRMNKVDPVSYTHLGCPVFEFLWRCGGMGSGKSGRSDRVHGSVLSALFSGSYHCEGTVSYTHLQEI